MLWLKHARKDHIMAQRYQNLENPSTTPFRVVSLIRKQNGQKTASFMAVALDENMETLKFFQENMQEVIQNLKMVKQLEAIDRRRYSENLQTHATRGLLSE
jgi:hypothetical protein